MKHSTASLLLAAAILPLTSCSTVPAAMVHPEARSYDASRAAAADVDAALARAASSDRNVLLVMGANWCHDSRALAGTLATPRFQSMLDTRYELVFVNVGMPQTGDGHNLGIAKRFGIAIEGTPTVIVLARDGAVLNADTAISWRNAASRSDDAIYEELIGLAHADARSPSG